jgi:hypothetical protein
MESLLFIKSIESFAIDQKKIDMREMMLNYTLQTISKITLGSNLSESLLYVSLSGIIQLKCVYLTVYRKCSIYLYVYIYECVSMHIL